MKFLKYFAKFSLVDVNGQAFFIENGKMSIFHILNNSLFYFFNRLAIINIKIMETKLKKIIIKHIYF
jgi:hypothetical protein